MASTSEFAALGMTCPKGGGMTEPWPLDTAPWLIRKGFGDSPCVSCNINPEMKTSAF